MRLVTQTENAPVIATAKSDRGGEGLSFVEFLRVV